jgi:hypothetical protein
MKQGNSLFNGLTHSHRVFLVLGSWFLVYGPWLKERNGYSTEL